MLALSDSWSRIKKPPHFLIFYLKKKKALMNCTRFYLFSLLRSTFFCVCVRCMRPQTHTHTFLHMWCEFRCPVGRRTLTQCPVRESTVSLQAPTAGWLSVPRPARADSCSFPSPCSPTVEPCAASTFPECRRWRNDPALTSQTPRVCVCVFSLSSPLLPHISVRSLFPLPEERSVYL